MSSAPWYIKLFGQVTASRGDKVVNSFRTQQTARLLACLAYRPDRAFRRDEIIEMFWPQCEPEIARNRLSVALSSLRHDLGSDIILPISITGKQHIKLDCRCFTTDVDQFESALRTIDTHSPASTQIETYARALGLYRGELLPGIDDEWTLGERQRIAERYLAGVRSITRLLISASRHSEALEHVRCALRYEPLSEDLHRLMIQILCALGRRSEALSEHTDLVERLRREFGIAPSKKTTEMVEQVLFEPSGWKIQSSHKSQSNDRSSLTRRCERDQDRGPLFGRDENVYEVSAELRSSESRLISLTGIGGVGKSRLAYAVYAALEDMFGENRLFVPLAETPDARHLEISILRALDLRTDARTNTHVQAVDALKGRPVLLVLDNIEQILPGAASVIRSLLDDLPELKCLVTSRQRLNLTAEREYPVLPLQTPALSGSPHRLVEFPSVQLFLHRAGLASRGFDINSGNADDLAAICHHLEGLPLSIEMAAAWTRVLAPREILERLKPRLPMLVSRDADASNRHASVRHTLQSSYDMLPDHLQQLFNRLSVFRGGWSAAAAEALSGSCPGAYGTAVVDLMELRDRSLVTVVGESDPIRLTFLELVREFAAERLADSGDRAEACEAHAMFFLNLAESASPHLRGPDAGRWLDALDLEQDNLREALRWTLNGDAPERGSRFAASLWQYWLLRGHIVEGIEWLTKAEARTGTAISSVRARVKLGLGNLSTTAGEYSAASGALNDSLALFQRAGDEAGEADALNGLGNLAFFQGDWSYARSHYERGLCLNLRLGNSRGEAGVLSNLANVAARTGDTDTALRYFDRCIAILRSNSDSHSLATILANSVGTLFLINDLESADERLRECVELSLRDGYPRVLAHSFEGIATVYLKRSRWREATVMFAAAAGIRDRIKAPLPESHRANYGGDYDMLRDAVGSEAFERAWLQGANMSDDAAAEYCLGRVAAEFDRAHAI